MNTLMLERPGRISPSSSRRVEEGVGASGLPLEGSIAGNLTLHARPDEWRAYLKRLGQERSRVESLPAHVPVPVEEELFKGLASTLPPSFWMAQGGLVSGCTSCVFVTATHHGGTIPLVSGQAYLVLLTRTDPTQEVRLLQARPPEPWEPIVPDADHAYTVGEMARAWKSLGREITEDDVPLSVDPDDYPLF